MKKLYFLGGILFIFVLWFGKWCFVPKEVNYTISKINHRLPTTIVVVNAVNSRISDEILEHLKKIKEKDEQNIVYATDVKLSRWEMSKLKPYVNQVMANVGSVRDYGSKEWKAYKNALKWLRLNSEFKDKANLFVIYAETNGVFAPYFYSEQIENVKVKKIEDKKRYVVFAGYNKDGVIEPYVIDYLKGLEEVTNGIVYIADSSLKDGELEKLKEINIIYTKHEKHNRYDFGSYAIGFKWLKDNGYLEDADEIIFANDSTYAPITSFKPMFDEMDKRGELDFWGVTQCNQFNVHLQSYFLVFRKQVFMYPTFASILENIPYKIQRYGVIFQYEIMVTLYLEALGYKWDSFISREDLEYLEKPIKDASYPLSLIAKHRFQFLKRKTFMYVHEIEESVEDILKYLKVSNFKLYQYILTLNPPRIKDLKEQGFEL